MQEYDETDEQISLETVPFQIKLTDLYRKVQFEAIEPVLEENPATETG